MIKSKIPTEHEEQSAFVKWFGYQFPHIRLYAIPNGIRTSFKQARKAKADGMSAGVPDIHIPSLKLYIEFKRSKGGVVSPEQKDWHNYLTEHCDSTVIIARGCDDGIRQLMEFYNNLTQSKTK